jgi:hypothetical protein
MKRSVAIAAALAAVGSGITGVAALPYPYWGSDVLFNVTRLAATIVGPYFPGGGSGTAGVMAAASNANAPQQTAPMTRMIEGDANTCAFNGGSAGSGLKSASGIVIGLDAVDVLSSSKSGGQAVAGCDAEAANGVTSVYQNGTTNAASPADGENWKWALALLYGGLDYSTCIGHGSSCAVPDCNSTARHSLVAAWGTIFGGACTKSSTAGAVSTQSANSICSAAPINNQLWHAFRPDDTSGTADMFASILGLFIPGGQPPPFGSSSLHGFGATPYCNALNWDTSTNNPNCTAGVNKQLLGPAACSTRVTPPACTRSRRPAPTARLRCMSG